MAKGTQPLRSLPRAEFGNATVTTNDISTGAVTANELAAGAVTGATLSANVAHRKPFAAQGTITTSTGGEVLLISPCAGTITAIGFVAKDALAKSDTNYISFGVVNKTQALTVVDATVAANTTKNTGGQALPAYGYDIFTPTANTTVAQSDVLACSATVTGTLANQVTEGVWVFDITPS